MAVVIEPPAVREAERQRQELRLGSQLVGNEQAARPQQLLAVLQCVVHIARGVQHICCQQHIKGAQLISLRTQY